MTEALFRELRRQALEQAETAETEIDKARAIAAAAAYGTAAVHAAAAHAKAIAQAARWHEGEAASIAVAFSELDEMVGYHRSYAAAIRALTPDPSLRVVTVEQLREWADVWERILTTFNIVSGASSARIADMRGIAGGSDA